MSRLSSSNPESLVANHGRSPVIAKHVMAEYPCEARSYGRRPVPLAGPFLGRYPLAGTPWGIPLLGTNHHLPFMVEDRLWAQPCYGQRPVMGVSPVPPCGDTLRDPRRGIHWNTLAGHYSRLLNGILAGRKARHRQVPERAVLPIQIERTSRANSYEIALFMQYTKPVYFFLSLQGRVKSVDPKDSFQYPIEGCAKESSSGTDNWADSSRVAATGHSGYHSGRDRGIENNEP